MRTEDTNLCTDFYRGCIGKEHARSVLVSNRSEDTDGSFIADLAVGTVVDISKLVPPSVESASLNLVFFVESLYALHVHTWTRVSVKIANFLYVSTKRLVFICESVK
jgi:hypothetical protein